METKKNDRANLEKFRTLFLQSGFIITLSLVLLAFEWSDTYEMKTQGTLTPLTYLPDELPPITRPQDIPIPERPKASPEIKIIPDDKEPETQFNPFDSESSDSAMVLPAIEPDPEPEADETYEFTGVEVQAQFPGGNENMMNWIRANTAYPKDAVILGIQGKVFVKFLIDKAGNVCDVSLERPVDPLLDKEALRVVKAMPQWKPARQNTKAVKVFLVVPIHFVLK
jgi:protein TonB